FWSTWLQFYLCGRRPKRLSWDRSPSGTLESQISMTSIVMDVGGPRANALMAEGLSHFASVSSTHDIFVLGEIVSTQKIGEQLRQECARADYVFVAPGKISLLEIVTELGLWGKTAVLDFRDSSELEISLLKKCRAYF